MNKPEHKPETSSHDHIAAAILTSLHQQIKAASEQLSNVLHNQDEIDAKLEAQCAKSDVQVAKIDALERALAPFIGMRKRGAQIFWFVVSGLLLFYLQNWIRGQMAEHDALVIKRIERAVEKK